MPRWATERVLQACLPGHLVYLDEEGDTHCTTCGRALYAPPPSLYIEPELRPALSASTVATSPPSPRPPRSRALPPSVKAPTVPSAFPSPLERPGDELFFGEAASYLGLTVARLRAHVRRGRVAPVEGTADLPRFRKADLDARRDILTPW